ncbi:MAG: hypothetical protein KC733_10785, partial [Candidatus Omnitrophica bacterium]|nr:hypothetical protein [Candidatus Omnitrophota bacterium]
PSNLRAWLAENRRLQKVSRIKSVDNKSVFCYLKYTYYDLCGVVQRIIPPPKNKKPLPDLAEVFF